MIRYLLDTNIISDLVRNPRGPVTDRIRHVGEASICTSIIVAAELRFGAAKKASPRLARQVGSILDAFDVLPFEAPADSVYANLRTELERRGQPIGGNDLLLAAQAVALGLTLVTDNLREFSRVGQVRCENWLREN